MTGTKICGVTTPDAFRAAVEDGAAFVGLVSFPASPRHLTVDEMVALLDQAGRAVPVVVLTVDADDAHLAEIADRVRPDFIQLHGTETPARAVQVRAITGAGIIKALPVTSPDDVQAATAWAEAADHLLFDARPPKGADRPGGLGHTFDWSLLVGLELERPWFLAGGLTLDTVAEAIERTGAPLVDVSSGVESAPGVKDIGLIRAFLDQARIASPRS